MSESHEPNAAKVVTLPDGSLQCGEVIHEPWPSLLVRPLRSLGFHHEIDRATPGSPFYVVNDD